MGDENIILGDGVFAVNNVDVALTRGGGVFQIAREYRQIPADGDYGPVKGRVRKIRSVATLNMKALELLPANMTSFYPAMELTDEGGIKDVMTAALDIADGDYKTVSWTGKTKAGKEVYIELQNAINLENLNWPLVDKDEIVSEVTMTAAYDPAARTTEPWKVEFVKDNAHDITFLVIDATTKAPIEGAVVFVGGQYLETGHNGVVVVKNKADAAYPYTVNAPGYDASTSSVTVAGADLYEVVEMTETS